MSLEYRVIALETRNPVHIAAMDEVFFTSITEGHSPPTLIFHRWTPAVSIAAGQRYDDINERVCKEQGVDIVRMHSGGRAVIHHPDTDISYSFIFPREERHKDPRKVYEEYSQRLASGLSALGIPVEVKDYYDIFARGKKLSGNAQRLSQKTVMQHGIILTKKPTAAYMLSLMNPKLYNGGAEQQLQEILTGVEEFQKVSDDQLTAALTHALLNGNSYSQGTFSQYERKAINKEIQRIIAYTKTPGKSVRGLCWLPDGVNGGPGKGAFVAETGEQHATA